jgi:1-acyl-sn-glycerol-3-phosphate acyltransferase
VHDPLEPKDYADRYAMKAAAYALYTRWNAQYLE